MTELNASVPAEPMSDEQLDVIAERWSLARAGEDFRLTIYESSAPGALNVALHSAGSDIETLLTEVRRLRAVEYQCGHCGEWEPADGDGEGQFCQSCGAEMILDECDSRDVLSGLRTDLAAAHERAEMFGTRLQQALDDKNTAAAHATNRYARLHLEHTRLAEQVQRIRELAVYFREREADLKRRYDEATDDAKATALLSSAALTGDAAHRVESALDGTEAGR